MLMCWNKDPEQRPPFSKLRSKFSDMLLADNKNHYIVLHIDHNKPCYQIVTPAMTTNKDACSSIRSLNAEHVGEYFSKSAGSSPSHRLHCSAERVELVGSKQHLTPQDASKDIESTDQACDSARRPISLHLPYYDQNKQNPYVDLPSRMASASLFLSADHRGNAGEIEMKQLKCEGMENHDNQQEISATHY